MSNVIVNYSPEEINGQYLTNQDQTIVLITKLKGLIELGLSCDLTTHTAASMHSYLYMLSDLVEELEAIIT